MSRVLINLVGDQPMPNLLPILQLAPRDLRLIASSRTERLAPNLERAVRSFPGFEDLTVQVVTIHDPYDLAAIEQRLAEVVDDCRGDVWLNLTGGTKIMSLAAHLVGDRRDLPMVYLVTERPPALLYYRGRGLLKREQLRCRVPIESYLWAYGFNMFHRQRETEARSQDAVYVTTARLLAQSAPRIQKLLAVLRQDQPTGARGSPFVLRNPSADESGIVRKLVEMGLVERSADNRPTAADEVFVAPSHAARDFLKSGWLELYAYLVARETDALDDCALNVYVRRRVDGEQEPRQDEIRRHPDNELDLVVSQNGRIAVVSCKAGKLVAAHFEELASATSQVLLGTYAAKVLVCSLPRYSPERAREIAAVKKADRKTAREEFFGRDLARHADRHGIRVVCADELPRLGPILAEVTA